MVEARAASRDDRRSTTAEPAIGKEPKKTGAEAPVSSLKLALPLAR
jgi:hypothetical protein